MKLVSHVRNQVRTLLHIRQQRHSPPAGVKPAVGARIACGDLRMRVQAGMSDSLWLWLTQLGWREVTFKPDRRRYRDIPYTVVTRLIDAAPERRERILAMAGSKAVVRTASPRAGYIAGATAAEPRQ